MKKTGHKVKFNGKPDIINSNRLHISSYFILFFFLSSDGFIFLLIFSLCIGAAMFVL